MSRRVLTREQWDALKVMPLHKSAIIAQRMAEFARKGVVWMIPAEYMSVNVSDVRTVPPIPSGCYYIDCAAAYMCGLVDKHRLHTTIVSREEPSEIYYAWRNERLSAVYPHECERMKLAAGYTVCWGNDDWDSDGSKHFMFMHMWGKFEEIAPYIEEVSYRVMWDPNESCGWMTVDCALSWHWRTMLIDVGVETSFAYIHESSISKDLCLATHVPWFREGVWSNAAFDIKRIGGIQSYTRKFNVRSVGTRNSEIMATSFTAGVEPEITNLEFYTDPHMSKVLGTTYTCALQFMLKEVLCRVLPGRQGYSPPGYGHLSCSGASNERIDNVLQEYIEYVHRWEPVIFARLKLPRFIRGGIASGPGWDEIWGEGVLPLKRIAWDQMRVLLMIRRREGVLARVPGDIWRMLWEYIVLANITNIRI